MKNILICIDWYLPAYEAGGPIQSIVNLTDHLSDDICFWIYTSNTDLNKKLKLPKHKLNCWVKVEKNKVFYSDTNSLDFRSILNIIKTKNFDAVYLNSMFSLKFSLVPLLIAKLFKIKIFFAPRGMLGDGALSFKKYKKSIFIKLFKLLGLHHNIIWHSTDITEKEEIKINFGEKSLVYNAPNLSKKVKKAFNFKYKNENHLCLFYLSRISPKKNLLMILELLNKIDVTINLEFDIIGPIDDEKYWSKCLKQIKLLNNNISVSYLGSIPNNKINEILKTKHLMILPTLHENFGHVIVDSWQIGCPVIISKNTPWKNLEEKNIGFDIDINDVQSFIDKLNYFGYMSQKKFNLYSKSSYDFGVKLSINNDVISQMKKIFNQ